MANKKIYWHTSTTSYSLHKCDDTSVVFFPVDNGEITAIVDSSTFTKDLIFNKYAQHRRYMYYDDIDMYGLIIGFKEGTAEYLLKQVQDLY